METKKTESAALSVKDVCALLSIGRTTLYKLLKTGKLRGVKCGRKTLILKEDLDQFVADLKPMEVAK